MKCTIILVTWRKASISLAFYLHNLGVALMPKYQDGRDKENTKDLEDAIELLATGVKLTPKKHYHRPLRLQVLSEARNLAAGTSVLNKEDMISRTIDDMEEALSLVAADHPDRGKLQFVLGMSLQNALNISESIMAFEQAARSNG